MNLDARRLGFVHPMSMGVALLIFVALSACGGGGGGGGSGGGSTGASSGGMRGTATFVGQTNSAGILISTESQAAPGVVAGQTTTDTQGKYTLTGLSAGTYNVYASSNLSLEKAISTTAAVTVGTTSAVSPFALTPVGSVTGTATLNGAGNTAGVAVFLEGINSSAYTDGVGNYKIYNVPVGAYTIAADYIGYATTSPGTVNVTIGTMAIAPTITLAVNPVPVAASTTVSTLVNHAVTFQLLGTIQSYAIVAQPQFGTLNTSSLPSVVYTPNTNYVGSDTFTFTATDSSSVTSSVAQIGISVLDTFPPAAVAGSNQQVLPGSPVTLTGSGTDPAGLSLTYSWVQTSGPAVTLTNANTMTATFTAPATTTALTFALTVNDGPQTSVPSTTRVNVGQAALSAGYDHALGVDVSGNLFAMGTNTFGELGVGTTTTSNSWTQVCATFAAGACTGFFTGAVAVAAGAEFSLAIKDDGTLWAWGHNESGELGINQAADTSPHTLPQQVGTATHWVSVATGGGAATDSYSFAIDASGNLWAWGGNSHGQLGGPSPDTCTLGVCSILPRMNMAIFGWTAISGGYNHTVGIVGCGTGCGLLYAWGDNPNGQLGVTSPAQANTPMQIGANTDWVAVTAAQFSSMGIRATGGRTAYGWGYGGPIGVNNLAGTSIPITTMCAPGNCSAPFTGVAKIASGGWGNGTGSFSLIVATNGLLYGTGNNSGGDLPPGTLGFAEQIGTGTNWEDVACTQIAAGIGRDNLGNWSVIGGAFP
jgi:alpha-tubulin suppressor-like RCC1 family protein